MWHIRRVREHSIDRCGGLVLRIEIRFIAGGQFGGGQGSERQVIRKQREQGLHKIQAGPLCPLA